MTETFEIKDIEEQVILVGVSEQDGDDAEDSLVELADLVKTAGARVVGTLIQKREKIHPGTYVGTGKVNEIAELIEETGATGIVCDDELSPAQLKNLEQLLDTKVMDRTENTKDYITFCTLHPGILQLCLTSPLSKGTQMDLVLLSLVKFGISFSLH